jgi:hypothetical protein
MDRVIVYLAGGIHTNHDSGENEDIYTIAGTPWRTVAKSDMPAVGIWTIDPKAKVGGFSWDTNEIVDLDLFDINRSTLVLAELMDESYPYIGTLQEMVYAKLYRKPIIVFANAYRAGHPWVQYHATKIFDSYDGATSYIKARFGAWVPEKECMFL